MTFCRKTLSGEVRFAGRGLHSGVPVEVRIHPGQEGLAFRYGNERIPACPESVTSTDRCTCLGSVSTVEHLMAAFAGLEVTDAEVEVSAPELPALDGSALPYAVALAEVGFEALPDGNGSEPFARIYLHEGERKIAISAGDGQWRYEYRSDSWPRHQLFERACVVDGFLNEVAPARTFGDAKQAKALQAAGYALGLDLDSALLLGEDGYANPARFPDEPARHKLLDALGDLYLAGVPVRFLNVVAQGTGHRMNVQAAAQLYRAISL